MPIIKQIPTTKIANYTTIVPFKKELVIIDHTLVTSDLLVPDTTKLLIGAKTVYKLIGDGIHFPTFDAMFVMDPLSVEYNKLEDAVNIITFIYDGIAFRYSITSFTSVDLPPYAVADYDLDDTVITLGLHRVVTNFFVDPVGQVDLVSQISVFDVLSSVHYTGVLPLQYGIQIQGLFANAWTWSPNAKDAKKTVDCNAIGAQVVNVRVTDGVISSEIASTQVIFQDNESLCFA